MLVVWFRKMEHRLQEAMQVGGVEQIFAARD